MTAPISFSSFSIGTATNVRIPPKFNGGNDFRIAFLDVALVPSKSAT